MSDQIFIKSIPNDYFYKFIDSITCGDKTKFYCVDSSSFKRSKLNNSLDMFLLYLDDYYHIAKKFYIQRKMTYLRFITILRQICKKNNIQLKSSMVYDHSKYYIVYYIENNYLIH